MKFFYNNSFDRWFPIESFYFNHPEPHAVLCGFYFMNIEQFPQFTRSSWDTVVNNWSIIMEVT